MRDRNHLVPGRLWDSSHEAPGLPISWSPHPMYICMYMFPDAHMWYSYVRTYMYDSEDNFSCYSAGVVNIEFLRHCSTDLGLLDLGNLVINQTQGAACVYLPSLRRSTPPSPTLYVCFRKCWYRKQFWPSCHPVLPRNLLYLSTVLLHLDQSRRSFNPLCLPVSFPSRVLQDFLGGSMPCLCLSMSASVVAFTLYWRNISRLLPH